MEYHVLQIRWTARTRDLALRADRDEFSFEDDNNRIPGMCGKVIQSSGPLRYGIVEGMDVRDSCAHDYSPAGKPRPVRTFWSSGAIMRPALFRSTRCVGVSFRTRAWTRPEAASRSMPGACWS